MPFEAGGADSRLYWLGEAAAVLLAEDLAARDVDVMTRDERLRAIDELRLPARASLSLATVIRVGELVGAADVVFGTLALEGDELTIRARSVRLAAGRMQPEIVERGPLPQLFSTFDRVAQRMSGAPVSASSEPTEAHPPLPAFESFVKGLLAGSPATAVKFLESALAQSPSYDAARVALWQIYTSQNDEEKALAAIAAIPGRSPLSRRGRFLASLSQLRLKQYDAAFATLKALGDEGPEPAISNNLGVVQLRRGAASPQGRASAFFRQAVEADPHDPDYTFNLGYAYWTEKSLQDATRWLRETVRLNPADADAHFVLGAALTAGGAGIEGGRELELARGLNSRYDDPDRRAAGTAVPVPSGLERVREDFNRAPHSLMEAIVTPTEVREQQELAAFYLDRGRRLYDAEQDREAIAELKRSLYLSPYQAVPHLLLARIYLRAGRTTDAIEAAKIALWCQDSAEGHVVLGEAYRLARDPQMARIEALRALALDPASATAKALLEKVPPK